jgi:transcriptional regulator with XRE-family HTH domain
MMNINNIIDWYGYTDSAILEVLGLRVKRIRLRKNITQQKLADIAGLDRTTIYEFENKGRPVSLLTFVQIIRALGKLDDFGPLLEEPEISPKQLAQFHGKQRRRAYPIHRPEINMVNESEPEW